MDGQMNTKDESGMHEPGGASAAAPRGRARGVAKLDELEHTAAVGESEKTPLILIGDVWVVSAAVFLVMVALALLAYRLAS
jgi:hypothetical protein